MRRSQTQDTPPPKAISQVAVGVQRVALAAAIWGTWSLFLRPAGRLGPVSSLASCLVVFVGATCIAIPGAALAERRDRRAGKPTRWGAPHVRRAAAWAAAAGATDAICSVLFFAAMAQTSLAIANLTHYLAPLWVALAAPALAGMRPRAAVLGAVVVALGGMVLLLAPWEAQASETSTTGALLGAASSLFFAVQVMWGKHAAGVLRPSLNLALQRAVAAVVMIPFGLAGALALGTGQWMWLLAGGAVINGLAGMLFFAGLARCPADVAASLTLLEPVSAVVLGMLVWSEPIGALGAVGMALVLASVYLGQRAEEARPAAPSPPA